MGRKQLLLAAALACGLAPALAYSQEPAGFTAYDNGWTAMPGGGTTLTLTAPATVAFAYPYGSSSHSVQWTSGTSDAKPQCTGLPAATFPAGRPGWKGTCTFTNTGEYTFRCVFHPEMVGTVKVEAPAAGPTPTPAESAAPTPTPTATTAPSGPSATPVPTPASAPIAPLAAKVAAHQKGTRVRGSVTVTRPASRLEVTVKRNRTRVGRYLDPAAASGPHTFTVALDARGRRALKRHRSVVLTVTVTVATQRRAFAVRLRR